MSSEQNSSRWLRVPWRLAGAAVLLIFIALLWWSGTRESPLDKEITRRLAELRASGEPIDAQDLARLFPNPPPSEDAGVLLTNILAFAEENAPPLASPIVNPKALLTRDNPLSEPVIEELRAYRERTQECLNQWPQSWPTGTRFAPYWAHGLSMTNMGILKLIQVRQLAQMLATLALLATEENDPRQAADMLERSFQLSRAIPSDSLVNHMVRQAVVRLGATATERSLNRTHFDSGQLRRIAQSLPPLGTNRFTDALQGEHCQGIWVLGELKAGKSADLMFPGRIRNEKWWERMWRRLKSHQRAYSDEDFASYLAIYQSALEIARQPSAQSPSRAEQLMRSYDTNATSEWGRGQVTWSKAFKASLEADARLAALHTSLAVESYRLAHSGKIPAGWPELVPDFLPAVPRDPFDGQPLRFKTLPRGYVIYGIGADGVDDGGLEKTNNAVRYDVTITVER